MMRLSALARSAIPSTRAPHRRLRNDASRGLPGWQQAAGAGKEGGHDSDWF